MPPGDDATEESADPVSDAAGGSDTAGSTARAESTGGGPSSHDPRRIGSLAVTGSDVVDALEATARSDRNIVLRVTPPFSGRMRARLHDAGAVGGDGDPDDRAETPRPNDGHGAEEASPLEIPPERFVVDPPPYPTVDGTADDLRASSTPYSPDEHRERHRTAVEAWRRAVRTRLTDSVTLALRNGETTVSVAYLR
jgi:hypothetical protein